MIEYNTKDWKDSLWKIFLSIHRGKNYRILLFAISLVSIYTGTITYLNIEVFNIKFRIDPFFFSLLGIIISLFLVFRLNSAYSKWWEGRLQWGALVNRMRTLSAYLSALLPKEDNDLRGRFAKHMGNFCFALKGHLRGDIQFDNFDPINEDYIPSLKVAPNVPQEIMIMIFEEVESLHADKKISDIDKLNIKTELASLHDILGGCERIKNTPIPFSHSSFFKSFLVIYIISLPFGFVNTFLYLTIPATMLISYALLGVEIISEEIEEPFGKDPNDLPTTFFSMNIRKNIYHSLKIPVPDNNDLNPIKGSKNFKIIN